MYKTLSPSRLCLRVYGRTPHRGPKALGSDLFAITLKVWWPSLGIWENVDIRHIGGSSSHFLFFLCLSGHVPSLAFLSLLDPHRNSEKQCDSVVTTLLSFLLNSALTGCLGTYWRRVLGRNGNLYSLKDFSASSPQWRRNILGVQSVTRHIENEYVPSSLTSRILASKFQYYLVEDTTLKLSTFLLL